MRWVGQMGHGVMALWRREGRSLQAVSGAAAPRSHVFCGLVALAMTLLCVLLLGLVHAEWMLLVRRRSRRGDKRL
jgi:hypothetical protein